MPQAAQGGITPAMRFDAPFVLLDDARPGGRARLYRAPRHILRADRVADVAPLLASLRAATRGGAAVAGYLAYAAGAAFVPRFPMPPAPSRGPLAWFGVFDGGEDVDAERILPDPRGAFALPAEPQVDRSTYDAMIARTLDLIVAGDIYQANVTFPALVRFLGDPLALYARLRGGAAAGWGAVVATGEDTFLSLSPECFFTLSDGDIVCRPMKGTAPRLSDAGADAAAARTLGTDAKQRAENLMIVDLMRNDLSRIAQPGSVAVSSLFEVEHYPTVHQLTSTIRARIGHGRDAIDVLEALFPCGSITGAPKSRAAQIVGEVEQAPRGVYTGAIGRIDASGDAAFNVAIRTLSIAGDAPVATLGLGGGIVADSVARDEWQEALAKGGFVTYAGPPPFDLVETMRFDPAAGLLLVERHLARMRRSAAALGFAFDRHDTRNELQAATFRLRQASRVRLLLAASGRIAIEIAPMPAPPARPLRVAVVPLPVPARDLRLRHKTSARAFYDTARHMAGTDEVVFVDDDGFLTEGSFTTLFVRSGTMLLTPPASRPLLPGILREYLIAEGRAREHELRADDLSGDFLVGNALRGLVPAVLAVAENSIRPV